MEIINTVFSFLWPVLSIFGLVVAIIANNRYRHSSTVLLLVASVIQIGVSLSYPLVSILDLYNLIDSIYPLLSVVNFIGSILAVVALFQLVTHISELGEETKGVFLKF